MELRKSPISYIILVIAAYVFIYFTIKVKSGGALKFDQVVNTFLTSIFSGKSYPFFKLLNHIGSSIGIGLTALITVAIVWMKAKDYLSMAIIAITISTGSLLNKAVKNFVGRPRPETEHLVYVKSLSFPSGHAMMSTILYLLIAYFMIKSIGTRIGRLVIFLIILIAILLMGISRIVLKVHYPSDVLAGYTLGIIWAILGIFIYEFVQKKTR